MASDVKSGVWKSCRPAQGSVSCVLMIVAAGRVSA